MKFDNESDLLDKIRTAKREDEPTRGELCRYQSFTRCYYLGEQWMRSSRSGVGSEHIRREYSNYSGETGPIRAIINRVTLNAIRVSSATNPSNLDVEVVPSNYSTGSVHAIVAKAGQALENNLAREAGFLQCARRANFERTISGVHGIGVCAEKTEKGRKLRCFDFDASRLILDPAVCSTDLRDHDWVIYNEVFTVHKLRRMFGSEWVDRNLDERKMPTISQLMPMEMEFYHLSGGKLYSGYFRHSSTKGAIVRFMHIKGDNGVFDRMFVTIDGGKDQEFCYNFDDPETPYGGDGLPYVLLYGHKRPVGRIPISDVGMMISDQDRLNLLATMYYQQLYNYTHRQKWFVDSRWFGRKDEGEIRRDMAMQIVMSGGQRHDGANPPQIVGMPEPSGMLIQEIGRAEDQVREQSFRAEAHTGKVKSHVTTTNLQTTLEQSQLPLDDRLAEDRAAYEKMHSVMLGTAIKILGSDASGYIENLANRAGVSEYEMRALEAADHTNLHAEIVLQNPGIRYRSRAQRREDVIQMAQLQIIDPIEMSRVLSSELDMPISKTDLQAAKYAKIKALQVRDGAEYVPLNLGKYSAYIVTEMRNLLLDDQTELIDGAMERLDQAIDMQMQFDAEKAQQLAPPEEQMALQEMTMDAGMAITGEASAAF
jgi:hypothetical protein